MTSVPYPIVILAPAEQSQAAPQFSIQRGNLYGATYYGGEPCGSGGSFGCGVIYELSPPSAPGGAWTETVIYSFCGDCEDGGYPAGKLTFDKPGNLYGTTCCGGSSGTGTVFELSPGSGGVWSETVLYSFCLGDECASGSDPEEGVTFDKSGNLYGTTWEGGSTGYGVAFKLSPGDDWTETVLYDFSAPPGAYLKISLLGPVSIDPLGNIYTTGTWWANGEGDYLPGDVYEFTTNGGVNVYPFHGKNGSGPLSGVVVDTKRRVLYGTTSQAKAQSGDVFQLGAGGKETVLYAFCQQSGCTDGRFPGGLVEDESGNLYGATQAGGAYDQGVVFEITP
jgi:uncharacterized repeat protein (TIGR03803 family)